MKNILATIICPQPIRYFADPAPVVTAPPPGGEGGAGGGDPNSGVMDFTPPDLDLATMEMGGKAPDPMATSTPTTPSAKTDPPKTDPPKTDLKTPSGDPPAKQLRQELETTKTELETLKATLEKGDPRIAAAEKAVNDAKAEIESYKKQVSSYERKMAMGDPAVTKRRDELDAAYGTQANEFYEATPELSIPTVNALVTEYHALPFGKPEYKEARAAFENQVNSALGGDEHSRHWKLGDALKFIGTTHKYALERPKVEKEISESALKMRRAGEIEGHTKRISFVRENIEMAKKTPDGLAAREPYHPKVVIDAFFQTLPEEQRASIDKGIPEFLELAIGGMKPMDDGEYAGMTPEQVAESRAEHAERFAESEKNLVSVAFNGLRSMRLMPSLVKRIQQLEALVAKGRLDAPPNPAGGDGGGNGNGGSDDIANFQQPDLSKLGF